MADEMIKPKDFRNFASQIDEMAERERTHIERLKEAGAPTMWIKQAESALDHYLDRAQEYRDYADNMEKSEVNG
jgi:hypothetical protein